jgi:hypothetical protein
MFRGSICNMHVTFAAVWRPTGQRQGHSPGGRHRLLEMYRHRRQQGIRPLALD